MKSILLEEVGKTTIKDIPKPVLNDNEVLVKTEYLGICGSDMHVFEGNHAFRKPPVILGHEMSGIVVEIGTGVTKINVGDRVTALPSTYCNECEHCKSGNTQQCLNRKVPGTPNWIGSFVEFFNVHEDLLFRLPETLDIRIGVLAEPLSVTVRALSKIQPKDRENLLLLGTVSKGVFL